MHIVAVFTQNILFFVHIDIIHMHTHTHTHTNTQQFLPQYATEWHTGTFTDGDTLDEYYKFSTSNLPAIKE